MAIPELHSIASGWPASSAWTGGTTGSVPNLSQDYIKLNLYKIEKQMENFRQSFKQKNFRKVKVGDKRKIEKRT